MTTRDLMAKLKLNMSHNNEAEGEGFDFSKPGESIHFVGDYVVKYFADPKQVTLRVRRAQTSLHGYVPEIAFSLDTLFGYKKVEGGTIYSKLEETPDLADSFFTWCQDNFWNPDEFNLRDVEAKQFVDSCHTFYHDKTRQRIADYWQKIDQEDVPSVVNGVQTPTLASLLDQVDWQQLTDGVPSRFHGDLQFDNIIATDDSKTPFVLIDWRGDFGGLTDYGDVYYDLAKLYGGLTIAYSHVKKGVFGYSEKNSEVVIELPLTDTLSPIRERYEALVQAHGYDLHRVQVLTGLIFLNMSPLHHAPFDVLLHHLGKATLVQALSYETATAI